MNRKWYLILFKFSIGMVDVLQHPGRMMVGLLIHSRNVYIFHFHPDIFRWKFISFFIEVSSFFSWCYIACNWCVCYTNFFSVSSLLFLWFALACDPHFTLSIFRRHFLSCSLLNFSLLFILLDFVIFFSVFFFSFFSPSFKPARKTKLTNKRKTIENVGKLRIWERNNNNTNKMYQKKWRKSPRKRSTTKLQFRRKSPNPGCDTINLCETTWLTGDSTNHFSERCRVVFLRWIVGDISDISCIFNQINKFAFGPSIW